MSVVSGATGTLTRGSGKVVVAGGIKLVVCGDVVSVVSGGSSIVVVVAGIEVVATIVSTGRGMD